MSSNCAIMQPYFFPYLGYFQMAEKVDTWVIFDDTQYIKKGWISRNRILNNNPGKEFSFINLPLEKPNGKFIKDIQINNEVNFVDETLAKLHFYKKISRHYEVEIKFVEKLLSIPKICLNDFLLELHTHLFGYFDISAEILLQSKDILSVNRNCNLGPGQWALEIALSIGADTYVNPAGGAELFCKNEFSSAGLGLKFFEPTLDPYYQSRPDFVQSLSVLDPLLLHGREFLLSEVKKGAI